MAEQKKLAVIDGKSVFYRGYYAMPNLSTKDGTSTGGVYGFASMALEVLKKLKPDYVGVAWDKPKTNIRKRVEMYPAYKAGRKPAPPDFYEQIPLLHELLEAFGWPLYELDDYEADDIMGTLALQAIKEGIDTQLVTSDLDMLQLVHPKVHVYALKKGLSNIELFRPESFILKYGITPEQFLDLKALKGDSSDNIPGVPGIGEKGALELLKEFKTLDGVYENLDLVKESTRKKLEIGKKSAYLSKKIAALWTDAPIKLDLAELDVAKCDPLRVREILQKLEFRSLIRQLPEAMQVAEMTGEKSTEYEAGRNSKGKVIDSDKKLSELSEKSFGKPEKVVVHSRAAGKHGKNPQLLIISPDDSNTYILDLTKLSKKAVSSSYVMESISKASLIGHDLKITIQFCYELGVDIKKTGHDTQIGAFLLNPIRREFSLTELATAELGYDGSPFEDCDVEELTGRASEIVSVIAALAKKQAAELGEFPKLDKLAKDIEWPVIPVLAAMEYEGIKLDTDYLEKMNEKLDDRISDIEQQIYGYANQEFNISSPSQLSDILFNKLSLPKTGIKRGKTTYSTAARELDKLRGVHPIIDLITEYREHAKLQNTYVEALPKLVDENSRLHTSFNLTIAQTGRLSSTDPNLQNIPVRTELGRQIRTAFVTGEGNVFISADYSQFELRLAAYLSGDEDLIDMFNRDVDVHVVTAAEIYGREPEDVTKNMRRDAKVVNFGVMYGLSPHGLSAATGMTYEAAKHFIEKYFEVRPKLLAYIESVKKQASDQGYVETIFGRRRPTSDVHSTNFAVREAAMRAAVNMPFQGSAADIMKLAMIKVEKVLQAYSTKQGVGSRKKGESRFLTSNSSLLTPAGEARILLQIHDSLIVECPEDQAKSIAKLLKDTMENVHRLPVKLTVDTSIGKNWGEL